MTSSKGAAKAAPSLDELADQIRVEIEAVDQAGHTALAHAIRAGELLTQAKAQVQHGEWLPWLAENFALKRTTAFNYMTLAANVQRVEHLGSVREALKEIAPPPRKRKRAKDTSPSESRTRLRQRIRQVKGTDARTRPRWTLEDVADVRDLVGLPNGPTAAGKRMHTLRQMDPDLKRMKFWEISWACMRVMDQLRLWKITADDMNLDDDTFDAFSFVLNDILYTQERLEEMQAQIESRFGEQRLIKQIQHLRDKTVERGATPEEAELAAAAADRLQRKLDRTLAA